MQMLIYLHFAGYLQLVCSGKTALHANSSSEAIGFEDWGTIHCEVEVIKKTYNLFHFLSHSSHLHSTIMCFKGDNFAVGILIWILI